MDRSQELGILYEGTEVKLKTSLMGSIVKIVDGGLHFLFSLYFIFLLFFFSFLFLE